MQLSRFSSSSSFPVLIALIFASSSLGVLGVFSSHGMVLPILATFLGIIISLKNKIFFLLKQTYEQNTLLFILLTFLCLWMLMGVFWSHWPSIVVKNSLRTGGLLLACCIVWLYLKNCPLSNNSFKYWEKSFYIGVLSLIILLYFEIFTHGLLNHYLLQIKKSNEGVTGHFLNPAVSLLIVIIWPILYHLYQSKKFLPALLIWGATLIIPFQVNFHTARWAFVFSTCAYLGGILWGSRFVKFLIITIVILLAITPLLVFGPFHPDFVTELDPNFRSSGLHRLYIWQFAVEKIFEHPFLGWGLNTSRYLPGAHNSTPVGGEFLSLHPHNGALQIWLELGGVGVVLVASLILKVLWPLTAEKDKVWRSISLAMIVAVVTFIYFSFGIWQSWWIGSVGLGIGIMSILKAHHGKSTHERFLEPFKT